MEWIPALSVSCDSPQTGAFRSRAEAAKGWNSPGLVVQLRIPLRPGKPEVSNPKPHRYGSTFTLVSPEAAGKQDVDVELSLLSLASNRYRLFLSLLWCRP